MKTTLKYMALRQQIIARALSNFLANEFGLFKNRGIENRLPPGHCHINRGAMPALNPSNLMASLLGIQLT